MPSLFAALGAAAGATVDAVFSEGFTFTARTVPQTARGRPDVNARVVFDPIEETVPFVGTFVARGALVNAEGRGLSGSTTHDIQGSAPMIDVALSALPKRPKRGDLIVRDDTAEAFTVVRFDPADFGRARIHLVEADAPERTP